MKVGRSGEESLTMKNFNALCMNLENSLYRNEIFELIKYERVQFRRLKEKRKGDERWAR